MRPRGLSSSSPSSTYVGQVAVQKPQCTQARRIFSDAAISGSASCSKVKSVCTSSDALDHAARVQDMARVEGFFDPLRQRRQRRGLRLEHRDRAAQPGGALDEAGVPGAAPVGTTNGRADHRGAGIVLFGNGEPYEAAAPVE